MHDETTEQPGQDRQDNKRAFRWGAIAAALVAVLALGYNMVSYERAGPLSPETATSKQRQQSPAPPVGGANDAAEPGTAGGSNTGAATGTGQPSQPGK